MKTTFDVVLIGGGIMGCATAFELTSRGLRVAIIEKSQVGKGPTGDSAAIIRQHYSNRLTAQMAHYGVGVFAEFEDIVGESCGFVQTGFAVLAPESDKAQLEANLDLQRSVGIEAAFISLDELQEIFPNTPGREGVICVYEPDSGYADATATVNAYARAAERQGATLFENVEVLDISMESDRVTGVVSSMGQFTAPCVINCAGAWGARVAAMVGVPLPINSCRAQVAVIDRPNGFPRNFPVVIDLTNGSFIRPYSESSVFGGLVDPTESEAIVDPDNYLKTPDPSFLNDSSSRLQTAWPDLREAQSVGGYASLYAITPDWHPIVDAIPGVSGFYICSGFSGHGFKLAPAVARMTADMVMAETKPAFDRAPFRVSRFTESSTVKGSYTYSILG